MSTRPKSKALAALLLTILASAVVLVFAVAAEPSDAPPNGRMTGVRGGAGDQPEHVIDCFLYSNYSVLDSDSVSHWSATSCSDWNTDMQVKTTIQRRRGVWPIYWWDNISSSAETSCVLCDYWQANNQADFLVAARYRIVGDHWITWQPGHSGPPYGTSYSSEFNWP